MNAEELFILDNKDKDTLLKHMPWSKELPEDVSFKVKNFMVKKNRFLKSSRIAYCTLLDLFYKIDLMSIWKFFDAYVSTSTVIE